jgi:hypothetical protein
LSCSRSRASGGLREAELAAEPCGWQDEDHDCDWIAVRPECGVQDQAIGREVCSDIAAEDAADSAIGVASGRAFPKPTMDAPHGGRT